MFALRQRRLRPATSSQPGYQTPPVRGHDYLVLPTVFAFVVLLSARLISALFNLIHDCDEVYNYWEPLHYLLYGYGMQTWEYSAEFALRSYWYLLLHAPAALLAALVSGGAGGKVYVFYATKAFLGLVSACAETALYRAVYLTVSASAAHYLLLLLVTSCGMFTASTSLLPSSFAMYAVTWAAGGVLMGRGTQVITAAVVCVLWGWPVAGIALVPFALYILLVRRLLRSILTTAAVVIAALLPVVAADRLFYGKWTVSLWNFLRYNVAGGGDSALYGTESATFYLRNGALNLNIALPLALLAPFVMLARAGRKTGSGIRWRLLIAISPAFVWLAAISALPHKEERFLYVVYPLVCLAAAIVLSEMRPLILKASAGWLPRRFGNLLSHWVPTTFVLLTVALSLLRATALVKYYAAPLTLYRSLPEVPIDQARSKSHTYVCVGEEWHRFPSAFFLPSPHYRLAFIQSSFTGLLPRPFNYEEGGTAAASKALNNKNREEPANYWKDSQRCSYLVELRKSEEPPRADDWKVLAEHSFVVVTESPSLLARALYIPGYSQQHNRVARYTLYERMQ